MSGNSFVPKDRPRVFNRRANVKVLRLRIVRRNEKETRRIFVINAGRIHETTRTGWLERLRQLPNLKWAKIIGHCHEIVFPHELDHLLLATFVSFQERRLIGRNLCAALRIGISQLWIGQKRFQRTITRQLHASDHLHLRSVERQQKHVLEIIIVVRFAHGREIHHLWRAFFQFGCIIVQSGERDIARLDKFIVFVRRKTDIERH